MRRTPVLLPLLLLLVWMLGPMGDQTACAQQGLSGKGGATAKTTSQGGEARAEFERADRELNEAWAEAKRKLPEVTFTQLKGIQRDWITYRDEHSEPSAASSAAARNSPAYWRAAAHLSSDRAAWLRRLSAGEEEPLTGLWTDGNGGTLEIVQQGGKLYFDLQVVRGTSQSLGLLAGTGVWNDPIGWFSDKGRDPAKTEETNLAFIRRDLKLEVLAAGDGYYHGNRAYFTGQYFKAASLGEKEQAATRQAGTSGRSSAEQ